MELVNKVEYTLEEYEMSRRNKAEEETSATTELSELENDAIWDRGVDSNKNDLIKEENEVIMPKLMSLSEKVKMEEDSNEEYQEVNQEKEEKRLAKEARKLKKELKLNDLKLKESTHWSFSPVIPCHHQGEIRKYTTVISAYDLASMWENKIRYISGIQRGSVISPSTGKEKDNFSNKHVMDIFRAYTENTINGNTIVLNYSLDNEAEIIYDAETNSISGEGHLQAVDCSHRARAAVKWKSAWIKHPDQYEDPRQFQFTCEVNNISDDDARQMFAEYNNYSLKVNKTRISYLDISNTANQITRKIMSLSDLKGHIETVGTSIRKSSPNVITFGVLSASIKRNYAPQTKSQIEDVSNWMVEFIDELVSIFPQFLANPDIEKRNILKKKYFTIEPLAINAIIALSASLKDDRNWKIKLAKLDREEFFLRTASRWRSCLRNEDRIINTSTSMKYFEETVKNWCVV